MYRSQDKVCEVDFFRKITKNSSEYETTTHEYYAYLQKVFLAKVPKLFAQSLKLLEAGCGTGVFGLFLLRLNSSLVVTGVDITPEMVDSINKKCISNYHAILGDLDDECLFSNNYFDVILCPFILHHFPTLDKVFPNLTKWLKCGGCLILLEPNGSNPVNAISKRVRYFLQFLLGKEFVIDRKLATPNETDHPIARYMKLLRENGYTILFTDTSYFPPKNVKLFSIGGLQSILYTVSNLLPYPCRRSSIIIIAKKVN